MKLTQMLLLSALAPAAAVSKMQVPHVKFAAAGRGLAGRATSFLSALQAQSDRGRRLDAHEMSEECLTAMTALGTDCNMGQKHRHLLAAHSSSSSSTDSESDFDFAVCENSKCVDALAEVGEHCAGMEATAMMCDPCVMQMQDMTLDVCDDESGGDICGSECGSQIATANGCMSTLTEMMELSGEDTSELQMIDSMGSMRSAFCTPCIRAAVTEPGEDCGSKKHRHLLDAHEIDPCASEACLLYAVNVMDACKDFDDTDFKAAQEMAASMEGMDGRRHLLDAHEEAMDMEADDDEDIDIAALVTEMDAAVSSCEAEGATIPESTVSELYAPVSSDTSSTDSSEDDDSSALGLAAVGLCAMAALA